MTEAGDDVREAATAAIESGVDCLVFPAAIRDLVEPLARVRLVEVSGTELMEEGRRTGSVISIASSKDVIAAIEQLRHGRTVLLETPDWTIIPLEDLVAARHGERLQGRVLAVVASVEEARLALGALEHGVDGVAVRLTEGSRAKALVLGVRGLGREGADLALTVGTVLVIYHLLLAARTRT